MGSKVRDRRDYVTVDVLPKERPHKFTCGSDGTIADKVLVQVGFYHEKLKLQTHVDFYSELARVIADHLEGVIEIEGFLDNCE